MTAPLRTLDPADEDTSDLAPLRDVVGDARLVCLGESAHAATEFYLAKDRLCRYLVAELGFTLFALESGLAEGLAVDTWVRGGDGDLDSLSRNGITYGFGDNDLFRAQLAWMRSHPGVGYSGVDMPGSGVDPGPAVAACLDRLPPRDGDDALREVSHLGDRYAAPRRWAGMGPDERELVRAGVAELGERAAGAEEPVRLCAAGAELVLSWLTDGPAVGTDHNPRDELMAATVRGLLDRGERVVLSAHNGHVQRHPRFGAPSLGTLLAPELGTDMVVIGTTRASGTIADLHATEDAPLVPASASTETLAAPEPHMLDARMDALGPLHFTDLRRLPRGTLDGVTAIGMQNLVLDVDPAAYDAVVHVREISPLPGVVETMQHAIDEAGRS